MTDYRFKSKPFAHQKDEFARSRDKKTWGIFWDQGTGKSKLVLDCAAWLFLRNEIDGLFLLAPNGVHQNWSLNEIPRHLPEEVAKHSEVMTWFSSKASTATHQAKAAKVLSNPKFAILSMTYDAIMTERGSKYAKDFLTHRRCLYVLDESPRIKTPSAKRTKRVLASSQYAVYRRILTGTPVSNSPFDIFTQLRFLDPNVWHGIGCRTFSAFKAHFGVWTSGWNGQTQREYKELVAYRNMDVLKKIVQQISSRVTKDEVLDLPPKLYSKRYFDMSPEQAKAYRDLRDECLVVLSGGGMVTAPLAIVRLLRLQQVTCGYLPVDDLVTNLAPLGKTNPRIRCLRQLLEDIGHKVIIWARFRQDIELILAMCREEEYPAVRYDGETSPGDRAKAIQEFQDGKAKVFVANPAAAGEGLTLHAARTVIYYNNSFKLTDRLQSEDRAHRIGQHHPVDYIDIVAAGTVDDYITNALREKRNIAAEITGDELREWI